MGNVIEVYKSFDANKKPEMVYVAESPEKGRFKYTKDIDQALHFEHMADAKNVRDDVLEIADKAEIIKH